MLWQVWLKVAVECCTSNTDSNIMILRTRDIDVMSATYQICIRQYTETEIENIKND